MNGQKQLIAAVKARQQQLKLLPDIELMDHAFTVFDQEVRSPEFSGVQLPTDASLKADFDALVELQAVESEVQKRSRDACAPWRRVFRPKPCRAWQAFQIKLESSLLSALQESQR